MEAQKLEDTSRSPNRGLRVWGSRLTLFMILALIAIPCQVFVGSRKDYL